MKRLWSWPVSALVAFVGLSSVSPASAACGGGGLSAQERELLTDFLILAVKPDGDDRDYKLVEIGHTKVDAGLLGVVINTLPLDFLGLGSSPEERTYNEAAETQQCRAACSSNAECRGFTYVRRSARQPVGVCHLKTFAEASSRVGVMEPVASPGERGPDVGTTIEPPIREPAPATTERTADSIVFDDSERSGRVSYAGDDARATPLTLRFHVPISNLKIFVHGADAGEGRTFANVDAFNAKGKRVGHTGTWVSAGKYNFNQGVSLATEGDRIAVVRITARDGEVMIDGIEFVRTLIAPPPVVAEIPEATPVAPPHERIPRPPRVPPITVEPTPLPPRVVAEVPTAPPRVITTPAPPIVEPPPLPVTVEPAIAAPPPAPEPVATKPEPPPQAVATPAPLAPPVILTAPEPPRRQLPIWIAVAALAFLFGGAGVYWRSHRARTLTRLTTRLVSIGLDRQTVGVDAADRPDIGLRFVVRSSASVGAPGTHIELVPAGALA